MVEAQGVRAGVIKQWVVVCHRAVVEVQLVIQAMAAMAPMVNVAAALPEAEALVVAEVLDVKAPERVEE
jgi:hypothetical protein